MPSCGSSVADKLFGGDDDYLNNSEIVKWPTPRDQAINTLLLNKNVVCGNLGMELCEDISTLLCVRSTSGRSVLVILFGGDDDDVNNFKLQFLN